MSLDVLEHNDRVVYHHTDCKCEPEQRHRVDRVAGDPDETKGANHGKRNRRGDNKCWPRSSQENEHDKDGEQTTENERE